MAPEGCKERLRSPRGSLLPRANYRIKAGLVQTVYASRAIQALRTLNST